MTKIITIANQKGGVGKTTTAVTLASGLAKHRYNTVLLDLDPQGQAAIFLGLDKTPAAYRWLVEAAPLADVIAVTSTAELSRPLLSLIASDKRTATAQILASSEGYDITKLAEIINIIDVDYLIIDTSPSVGLLQESALFASHGLVVPVAVDFAAVEGLAEIMATMDTINAKGGQCKLFGVLPTFYDATTRESATILAQIKETFGELVLPPIHRATILRECVANGETIWEHAPNSRAAKEYSEAITGVLKHE